MEQRNKICDDKDGIAHRATSRKKERPSGTRHE
jgi:hypothetical protein